jgi:DNA repair protein RadD
MSASAPAEWVKVNSVTYRIHKKPGKPDSMRVEYRSGLEIYREWVCFDHKGYPKDKALKWWRRRMTGPGILPNTTVDAVGKADALLKPVEIRVRKNGKYTEIIEFRFMSDVLAGGSGVFVYPSTGGDSPSGTVLLNALHG